MPTGLKPGVPSGLVRWGGKRYQTEGHDHLITFSCYHRRPYLLDDRAKAIFEQTLEAISARYSFQIHAYVLMPEHVHLLLSEPSQTNQGRPRQPQVSTEITLCSISNPCYGETIPVGQVLASAIYGAQGAVGYATRAHIGPNPNAAPESAPRVALRASSLPWEVC